MRGAGIVFFDAFAAKGAFLQDLVSEGIQVGELFGFEFEEAAEEAAFIFGLEGLFAIKSGDEVALDLGEEKAEGGEMVEVVL